MELESTFISSLGKKTSLPLITDPGSNECITILVLLPGENAAHEWDGNQYGLTCAVAILNKLLGRVNTPRLSTSGRARPKLT